MKRETKIGWVAAGMMLGVVVVNIAFVLGVLALGAMVVRWAWGG